MDLAPTDQFLVSYFKDGITELLDSRDQDLSLATLRLAGGNQGNAKGVLVELYGQGQEDQE